jgi:DUF1680 family protein
VRGLKSLSVNGQKFNPKIERGYAVITREWKAGDKIEMVLPMEPQRIKADENIAADRGLVALRYGPMIYNVERADQSDLNQPLASDPIKADWQSDLLGGVVVLKGKWANGTPMIAIPNFARMNRVGQVAESASAEPVVNYAPGSSVAPTATTNAPSAQTERRGRRGQGGPNSIVWMKDL